MKIVPRHRRIPDGYTHLAQDKNGKWHLYPMEPSAGYDQWLYAMGSGQDHILCCRGELNEDWMGECYKIEDS